MRPIATLVGILAYSLAICCAATDAHAAPYQPDLKVIAPLGDETAPAETPDVQADIRDLACAVHANPAAAPTLVGEAPCSGPGVYKAGAKNECVFLDYKTGNKTTRAMLYYPQLRGKSPKPAKMFYFDGVVWITVERPRTCG